MEQVNGYSMPPEPERKAYPTGKRELRLLAAVVVLGLLLADFALFSGLYLGFALAGAASIVAAAVYLLRSGCRLSFYSGALLVLSLVICGSFVRSNDGFVKLVMVCFLLVSANLGLCLLAGKNRRCPAGLTSLLDAPRAALTFGVGRLAPALQGIREAWRTKGTAGKNRSAVLVGLLISVPVIAVLIPLLIRADAAFEGLMQLLPEMDISEPLIVLWCGIFVVPVLYTRAVALAKDEAVPQAEKEYRRIHHLTVNTALSVVCVLYFVYFFSQLAYFGGSLAGILPVEFTMAEYARRGFFEMTWLCAINLGLMSAAVGVTGGKDSKRSTRLLCMLLGAVTLFLIATAGAKMIMYIDSYGLTRLRLLTSVIMVFFAVATVVVCIWLLVPKMPYMKLIVLAGLLIGAATAWADVDTVVACYNVRAYQSGQLEKVDVGHLGSLSHGAVPYLQELTEDADPAVARAARQCLQTRYVERFDIRSWNISWEIARDALEE